MKHCMKLHAPITVILALVATATIAQLGHALPGPAPINSAIAEYDPSTGNIVVSVNEVSNWYIESATLSMTGPDDVSSVLPAAGGFLSNSAIRVGETFFGGNFSYTDLDLGDIAATELALGDLDIYYNGPGFGSPLEGPFDVVYLGGPMFDPADLNQDGFVDGLDLGIQLGNWGDDVTAS
ncbi:MAG: hypothetical protein ABGX16_04650, partial [Pirellulales bacterium]